MSSDRESFVMVQLTPSDGHQLDIEKNIMFHHAQLAQSVHSVLSNGSGSKEGSCHNQSDGWSEVSCPLSHRSSNSLINVMRKASFDLEGSTEGTSQMGGGCGWHHIGSSSNGPILSSNSTTKEVELMMDAMESMQSMASMVPMAAHNPSLATFAAPPLDRALDRHDANTIGSVGSRVPFSWAEITKIQPKFHNEMDNFSKPKVFDQTPKIATRHQPKGSPKKRGGGPVTATTSKVVESTQSSYQKEDIPMPSIPETDPFANKSELGRRVRKKDGKRGSKLKYPNGKKGGNRNRRKKNSK